MRALTALIAVVLLLSGCAGGDRRPPVDTQRAAEANSALGMDYLRRGEYQRALDALLKAKGFDDNHLQANWGLGLTYNALGEPERAREHFEVAVGLSSNPNLLNSYGALLCEQGDAAEGVAQFQKAADHPRYAQPAQPLTNAGLCLFQAGQVDTAETYYQLALKKDPSYAPALGRLAELRFSQGRYLESRAFIQRADIDKELSGPLLIQAAQTELALSDHRTALKYLRRYNLENPGREKTLSQIADGGAR